MIRKLLFVSLLVLIVVFSCTKDKGQVAVDAANSINTDAKLFAYMKTQKFSYYKNDSVNKIASTSGFHSGSYFLKFNKTATSQLDGTGKLPAGATFSDSSLVVKELYNGSSIDKYSIMFKDSKSPFASGGWIWAMFNTDGTVVSGLGIAADGGGCNVSGCHANGNRDHLQSFDAHP